MTQIIVQCKACTRKWLLADGTLAPCPWCNSRSVSVVESPAKPESINRLAEGAR